MGFFFRSLGCWFFFPLVFLLSFLLCFRSLSLFFSCPRDATLGVSFDRFVIFAPLAPTDGRKRDRIMCGVVGVIWCTSVLNYGSC